MANPRRARVVLIPAAGNSAGPAGWETLGSLEGAGLLVRNSRTGQLMECRGNCLRQINERKALAAFAAMASRTGIEHEGEGLE